MWLIGCRSEEKQASFLKKVSLHTSVQIATKSWARVCLAEWWEHEEKLENQESVVICGSDGLECSFITHAFFFLSEEDPKAQRGQWLNHLPKVTQVVMMDLGGMERHSDSNYPVDSWRHNYSSGVLDLGIIYLLATMEVIKTGELPEVVNVKKAKDRAEC